MSGGGGGAGFPANPVTKDLWALQGGLLRHPSAAGLAIAYDPTHAFEGPFVIQIEDFARFGSGGGRAGFINLVQAKAWVLGRAEDVREFDAP